MIKLEPVLTIVILVTVPSAPKSEGGSSWYKSMFRSMLANDDNDEGTYYMLRVGSHDLCYT